jgi:glutamate racemase
MQDINKNNQPIGVFDSGVGGLSILIELKKLLPKENFVFLADQKYVPYGEKTKKQLVDRCMKITDYFVKYHDIKLMVIACNTASVNAIDALRKKYSIPIVRTVPAVKPASEKTKSGAIAVISTPSTSKSELLKNLIKENCQNVEVLNIGCKNLENAVEEGDLSGPKVKSLLKKYLSEIKDSNADYLVLGCTHYPFLKKSIQKIIGSHITLLDSGEAIAKHAKALLSDNHMKNDRRKSGNIVYFTTGGSEKFSKVATKLLKSRARANSVEI